VFTRIAATAALLLLGLAPGALADTTAAPGTLAVNGQGSVMVTPDQGTLSVSVTRSAPTAAPALSAANRRVNAIVAAARGLGVPAAQIQTDSVNTSCSRVKVGSPGHRRFVRRCSADESLEITASTASVGALIDAATRAGASSIDGPDFSFSDPSAGEIAAEHAAITDARNQANATAAQLGYTVTGVQSVQLNPQSGIGVSGSAASSSAKAAAPETPTTVHPGAQEVSATVAVTFTIAPAPAG
jgi:uncharacterized protein YggE